MKNEWKVQGSVRKSVSKLRQGPALEGRNSPVFAKRFLKGNK